MMAQQIKMTVGEHNERNARSKKMLMWFAMVSMFMTFAGLTSAYVVSSKRKDWIKDFELPNAFLFSTIVIIASSVTFYLAKKAIQNNNRNGTTALLLTTLGLGAAFVALQFYGFDQVIKAGFYFTGRYSSITTTFLYVIVLAHLVHLFAGLLVLLVVIYNHFKQKYTPSQTLGLELGAMFWHFLDVLWVYLFLFFYFY